MRIFLNQFYRNRVDRLERFVSPDFCYSSPAVKSIGFQNFVTHCNALFENVTVYIHDIDTFGEQCLFIDYSINISHDSLKDGAISMPGCAKFVMVGKLIENITVSYDPKMLKPQQILQKTTCYI